MTLLGLFYCLFFIFKYKKSQKLDSFFIIGFIELTGLYLDVKVIRIWNRQKKHNNNKYFSLITKTDF